MKSMPTLRRLGLILVLAGIIACARVSGVRGATTPQRLIYNGHLLHASGTAVTTPQTVRFSLWNSADYQSGEVTATGAINTAASAYAGWKDAFTVTPDARGYFSVELGSNVALPDFGSLSPATLLSLFLQVEVKPEESAATAYEVLDVNAADSALDRSALLSVPFALNADLLDQHHAGTGSGSIPVLGSGGLLDPAQAPAGTARSDFILDQDGSQTAGSLSLTFGGAIRKALSYDLGNGRFQFDDDLNVQGNLTVSGLINGVDITQISSSADNSHLKVSSGAGLTITIARGDYRLGGVTTQYAGQTGIAVTDNATNYVFFSSGGLTIRTTSFPTDSAIIPVATVQTVGGVITSVTDRRAFNSNDAQRTIVKVYEPQYEGAAYKGDGSNNVGQLSVSHSGSTLRNYYEWTSTRGTLQDYSVVLRVPLGSDFVRWGAQPVSLAYRTSSADVGVSALAVAVNDTAGAAVTLTGSGTTSLASTGWTTATWGFSGAPTWTAGGEWLITLTLSAKNDAKVQLGPLTIRFAEILSE